jgi:hypothetical protein
MHTGRDNQSRLSVGHLYMEGYYHDAANGTLTIDVACGAWAS